MAVVHAEVVDQMTATFAADDALWKEAVLMATEQMEKANALIRNQVAALGIPEGEAPQLSAHWYSRGPSYSDKNRRAELYKLADAKIAAMAKTAKAAIRDAALDMEEQLVLGGLEFDEARAILAAMPSPEKLMPVLNLDDLGVKRWQPPEDIATQLTTPLTPAQRRRRIVMRAIEANPGAITNPDTQPMGLCDSRWPLDEQIRRLIARKGYDQ